MLSRLIAAFVVLVTFGNIAVAGIDDWDERQQTLSGGQARGRAYNFFGFTGSDISRTRVSFSGTYQPGTIVINTGGGNAAPGRTPRSCKPAPRDGPW